MTPYYQKNDITIYHGDLREVLPTLDARVDHVATDPPYGFTFMGEDWDHSVPGPEYWRTISDVCKPGASILAFGGTRTYHRLACAIEDAGWEIRDCLMWLYSSGMPKCGDIGKRLAKQGKAELAKQYTGFAAALKPAYEPIVLAMKPLDGTYAHNAETHGVAGMNIDACRIGDEVRYNPPAGNKGGTAAYNMGVVGMPQDAAGTTVSGRWPANVMFDETPEGLSRYFYCGKASQSERGAGNSHPTCKPYAVMEYLLNLLSTPTGGLILDPFCGSGTTALAARDLGRPFIGVELDEHYCEIIANRLEAA
jgi:site-specific DNA-methyltransferase (adenine-specific)